MKECFEVKLAEPENCTGCSSCAMSCSLDAIHMVPNKNGFLLPEIDPSRCTECGVCTKSCPESFPVQKHPLPRSFAAQAEYELRSISTSGGVFSLLAQAVFEEDGVVCGAAFDKDFSVKHIFAENEKQLAALRGSKYVQSNTGDTFRTVKEILKKGRKVLYSGCPCQIAGLYSFLKDDYENLLTVDLLCLGISSEKYFKEYLSSVFPPDTIKSIIFRDKNHGQGWAGDSLLISTKDGGEHLYSVKTSSYEACYHNKIFLRECCYSCRYNTADRCGDISLGDFWGIEAYDASLNDNFGTSLVLANTKAGAKLIDQIKGSLDRFEAVPYSFSDVNRIHGKALVQTQERMRFLNLYSRYGYKKAAEYTGFKKFDVGIVGCWSVENHGSNLSYYALYQVIKDMGLEPLMIERPADAPWPPNNYAKGFAVSPYLPWELAPIFQNRGAMRALNQQCETFLLGSDQLFYHDLYHSFGEFADLGYIDKSKRKIAYAASIGRPIFDGTKEQRAKLSYYLKRFNAVSVREKDGVRLFAETFGVKADFVLDPVFLCNLEHYKKMAMRGKAISREKYIAVYILDPTPEKEKTLGEISKKLGMPCKVFSDVAHSEKQVRQKWTLETSVTATNEDWLRTLLDSEFVVTDSFHGTCFAILFQKPFLCIANQYRGASRFISLLKLLGLEDRMTNDLESDATLAICTRPLDYRPVKVTLHNEIKNSMEWLRKALHCQHDNSTSGYDLLDERVSSLEPLQQENRKRSLSTEKWLSNTHQRVDKLEKLYQRVDTLEGLYQRVGTLEGLYQRVDTLEGLYQRVDTLEELYQRVDTLEELYQRVDTLEGLYRRVDTLEGLYRRVDTLEELYQRVDILEGLYQRVDTLEKCTKEAGEILLSVQNATEELQKNISILSQTPWQRLYQKIKGKKQGR